MLLGYAIGWALTTVAVTLTVVLKTRGVGPTTVSGLLYSCGMGMGIGAYLAECSRARQQGDTPPSRVALIWTAAFCAAVFLGSNWSLLSRGAASLLPRADVNSVTLTLPQKLSPGTTRAVSESRSIVLMPGQVGLVVGSASFGALGGFFTALIRHRPRKTFRSIVGAVSWAVGALVGAYVTLVGLYVLGGVLTTAFGSAALIGLAFGALLAGFAGGLAAAFLALGGQNWLVTDTRSS